jgi:ATP-dependent exoDNAse (exonuclease V) alpha subunit
MTSLLERIAAQKAAAKSAGARPESQQISEKDIVLRGTGLTKREAEKNTRAYERETKASLKNDASKGALLKAAENEFEAGIQATIAEMKAAQATGKIILDDSQIRAVAGIMHNKVSVLIGAAGTGKTTVTKVIVEKLAEIVNKFSSTETNWVYVDINREDSTVQKVRMREIDAIRQGFIPEKEKEEMPAISFAAYTGRATQQLRRALPEEWHPNTSTIHSLLGYAPVYEEREAIDVMTGNEYMKNVRVFRPSFDASCKLPYQVYVFDEASMIPIPLFNEVIDAIHSTSRILLIGDIHQLPPVYGKSVLGYAMRKWPVFELTTIHRQAAGNAIISNAHKVLSGKPLENADNFHLIGNTAKSPSPGGQGELQKYMLNVVKKLSELNRYNPLTDAIIVPQNKGMVGSIALNEHLVTMFNPEQKENGIIVNKRVNIHTGTGHTFFAIRDKVMITANIPNTEPPITNGMIGIVESIAFNGKYDMKRAQVDIVNDDEDDDDPIDLDLGNMNFALSGGIDEKEKKDKEPDETEDQRQSSHVMTIKFENGQSFSCSTAGDYRRVQHGYAATCHKSQGGEYPSIIILCHSVNARMLSQEWLYTAITRARNNVYIICNSRGLDAALKRQVIKGFSLAEKIKSYIIETGSDEDGFDKMKYPVLWEPEEL